MIRNIVGTNTSYLIDTSILISALLEKEKEKKREIAVKVLSEGINRASVTEQNLIELINEVYLFPNKLNKNEMEEITTIIKDFKSVYRILYSSKETVDYALLLAFSKKISFSAAYISQIMFENGIKTIYTERDKEFKKIPGLKVINPFS